MDDRTKTFCSFFVLGAAIATVGCGFSQQSKFQTSFLPSTPHPSPPVNDIIPPPVVTSNPYVQQMPAVLLAEPKAPKRKPSSDALAAAAAKAFDRGYRFYQGNDAANARREFDSAIDMMLEAVAGNPADDELSTRLDDMVDRIHRYDLTGLGASADVAQGKFEKAPLEDILQMTFPVDPKLNARVREQFSSTVSQLPLTLNDTVLGYINYFANRGHRTIEAGTQRSGRYRPMIQRILSEEGVPQELIHLAQAESGFIPRAVSRAAAGGMWQFLMWRGQQYGLMQTRYTDDRMDPEKATRAAARHLRDLYNEFGDWYLAIAAYNCGPGVVEKAVERTGYADFWELRSRGVLPAETTNYVPIILAMTIMEKHAAEYGLDNVLLDPPVAYDTIEVSAPTSLNLIADIVDAPLAELATLNPSVLRTMVPEHYSVHVPKGTGSDLTAALEQIPAQHRDSWRMHRVGPGETLATIGKQFGASASSIIAANNLRGPEVAEGDRLMIPAMARPEAPARTRTATTATRSASTARHNSAPVRHAKAKAAPSTTAQSAHKPAAILAQTAVR